MSEFKDFKVAVNAQMEAMAFKDLYVVEVDKDTLWDTYIGAFPEGSNPMYRERTEHDCSCCKQFIRAAGNIVVLHKDKVETIWDINIGGDYQVVADALAAVVREKAISNVFLHYQADLGTDHNHEAMDDGSVKTWEHLHYKLPNKFVMRKDAIPTKLGDIRANRDVLVRSMETLTIESGEIVLELIEQNSLYRGAEQSAFIKLFIKTKKQYDALTSDVEREIFGWTKAMELKGAGRFRNNAIGTLLVDISEGRELDAAVGAFEAIMAPSNYKRPTKLITKGMIALAQTTVEELGLGASLDRRFAHASDITVPNIIWADRDAKAAINGSVFDELMEDAKPVVGKLDKVEEVTIEAFLTDIVPKASSIDMLVENGHVNNMMSLIAPEHEDAKHIFKWDNNFSWAYNGDIADSMKERVKQAGGDVSGHLRYSIQWNDDGDNNIDFDAHCNEPNGNLIYYSNKGRRHPTSGMLDVDIVNPNGKVAVENITWSNKNQMGEGKYKVVVHNYSSSTSKRGFSAEVECDGVIHSFVYDKPLRGNQKVTVAEFEWTRANGLKMIKSLPSTKASKEVWGIPTEKFSRVAMVMNSPNHWDGEQTGNKHYFFILDGCKNDEKARGFFNEFLTPELTKHRKVFEVLGSKMKADPDDEQLSGVGFSETQRNAAYFQVNGAMSRRLKVMF